MVLSSTDAECKAWLQSVLKDCGAEEVEDIKPQAIARLWGTYLTSMFCKGVQLISKMLGKDHVMQRDRLHEELIASQKTIIELQKQLIHLQAKDEQLKSVTSAVEGKVDEVAKEVRDYSAAVKSHVPEGSSSGSRPAGISSAEVRTAVKTALLDNADEEGRDYNVVIFGPTRAVKVVFRNAEIAKAVLRNAPKLRESEEYREVYVSPDRTPGQRAEQRALVAELKRKRNEEPEKSHYIRGGAVESVDVK
jgi:hypothetical protein